MHAPILALVSVTSSALSAILLQRVPRDELRWFSSTGATISLVASMASAALWMLSPITARISIAPFAVHVDALAATMLPIIALSHWALIAMTPTRELNGPSLARTHALFAFAQLSVFADSPFTLFLSELASLIVTLRILRSQRRNSLDSLVMTTAITALALVLLSIHGFLASPLNEAYTNFSSMSVLLILLASAIRLALPPISSWLSSFLEFQPMSLALPLALPLAGITPLARIVGPALAKSPTQAPGSSVILGIGLLCAAMTIVQDRLVRAYFWTAGAILALTCAGLIDPDPIGFAGGELLWAGSLLALSGLGLSIVAIKSRLGTVDLNLYYGLAAPAPTLAFAFLAMALANAGVPGSIEFAAADLLIHGSTEGRLLDLLFFALTTGILGANALRCSFHTFAGQTSANAGELDLLPRERLALAALAFVLVLGGLTPNIMPLLRSR